MRLCPECGARYAPSAATCARDGAALVDTSRDPLLGATIGEYQTLELVGSGGMAQVYRARHVTTGRRFAVKVLVGAAAEDQTSRERFVREAKAIQQISHPNVVGLVDWGTTPGGRRFLVLEWVDGRELEDAIREEAPFGPVRAARIARQVAEGLAAIHATGFVHRDVKPHNVMLFERGGVESLKIVDFGLVYADSRLWDRLTRMGDIVGTPFYMAPETIEGRDADERTDLYSLGVMIHEMIAGEVPFNSPAIPEILARHLREPPPLLPDCGGLETLVYELLAKSPDDRPRSAAEVVERLDALDLTMSMTAPERAPSFMTMVTQPGSPRPSIDTAIGEVRAPLTATIVAPSKVPREPTPIAQTQPSIVPPGAIVDSVEGTSDARDPETTDDTRDTTQHDVPEPFEAATFVAMRARPVSDLLELDVGPDTPQLPLPVLSTLPAPPPPPKVIVGPAADRDLDDTAVHDAGELPEETLPMASGTPATRTLPSAAPAREPLVVRDVVVRETVRELPTT
ncbi:serine/threonine protein kinase, partial [Myxococcota bacterium]|nr:serine/threonine protein kinase [Myxococcota bacterium]